MLMIAIDLLVWWYTAGSKQVLQSVMTRAEDVLESFSVGLLARTLFAPFRQIDAGSVRGPLEVQIRAWGSRMFSRLFGFCVRSLFIVIGSACAALIFIIGIVLAIIWLLVPLAPVFALMLAISGWVPWNE